MSRGVTVNQHQIMASSQEEDDTDIYSPEFRWKDGSADKARAVCKLGREAIKHSPDPSMRRYSANLLLSLRKH